MKLSTGNNRKRALMGCVLSALVVFSTSWAFAAEAPPLPGMTLQIGSESFDVGSSLWSYDAIKDTFSLTGPFMATSTNGSTFTIGSAEAIPDPLLFLQGLPLIIRTHRSAILSRSIARFSRICWGQSTRTLNSVSP